MNKLLLAGLGVVILVVVALILLGMGDDEPASPARQPASGPRPAVDAAAPLARPDARIVARQLPPDAVSRDHRTDALGEERPEPAIAPETVAAMRPVLLPIVKKCAMPLRSQSPAPKGRLVITLHVKARRGKVTVADVAVRQDLIDEPELVACVTRDFEAAEMTAPLGQDDGEQDVTMAFPVP